MSATLRVWATAAWTRDWLVLSCCATAAVTVLAALVIAVAWATVIPVVHLAVVALLPLALAGSAVTGMLLPDRRPVVGRAAAPVETPPPAAPGARRTRPAQGVRGGCAHSRPAAAPRTPAAAGPTYHVGRAPVPARGVA